MESHSKTYELYCSVVGRNIIIEEITFHNGTRAAKCLNKPVCRAQVGGCTNRLLCERIFKTTPLQ